MKIKILKCENKPGVNITAFNDNAQSSFYMDEPLEVEVFLEWVNKLITKIDE